MSGEIGREILKQLGGNKFVVMAGAKNLVTGSNYLQFKIGGGAKQKINFVKITLNGNDLYDIDFMRGTKIYSSEKDVYNDQLQKVFTKATGFDTHL